MKARIILDVDTETGDYEMQFRNVSKPGEPMDAGRIMELVRRAFAQVQGRTEVPGDTH